MLSLTSLRACVTPGALALGVAAGAVFGNGAVGAGVAWDVVALPCVGAEVCAHDAPALAAHQHSTNQGTMGCSG
jgi:hypothetical protein